MNKFIATSCEFRLTQNNWKEGEEKTISVWNEDVEGSDTVEGILKNVPYLDYNHFSDQDLPLIEHNCNNGIFENDPGQEEDYSRFDADLEVDLVTNVFGSSTVIKPSSERWTKFRNNEVNLYNLHITIYIRKVANLTVDDIHRLQI